jgi:hypothetical protein
MHNMGKNIVKTITLDAIKGEFLATVAGMHDRSAAFQRRIVLEGVLAVRQLHAALATLPEDGRPSIDKLHTDLASESGSVSKSTLDRWGRVSKIHGDITPSEGSASAVYAVTESGWTAARKVVSEAIESGEVSDADAIVDKVAESMNAHPRKVAAKAPAEVTASDVTDAPYSREAFAESVRALLDKVPDAELTGAIKSLRALVNGYKREAVNA